MTFKPLLVSFLHLDLNHIVLSVFLEAPFSSDYMAEQQASEGSSASGVSIGNSDSTIQLNIKTLDSRIYSFHVDKHTIVSAFKEKIANQCAVPVAQQRLIFRGKVLKDHHPLSEYNVENGDTLHLVERQPQRPPSSATVDPTTGVGGRGLDFSVGGPRIAPIAQSIVLGTLNIGDPAEGSVPDINRIIGAVLNTVGIGNQAGGMQNGVPTFHANGGEASQLDPGSEGNANPSGQSTSRAIPIPLGAAVAIPSLHMPIPDSLNTLVEFINRMELAFPQNADRSSQPRPSSNDRPPAELPLNSRGLPTVEALKIVLERAQTLLSNHAIPSLSRTAGRLGEEAVVNDPAVRGQMQMESVQLGMAMQHLGALFLELGRTILTLRLGQTSGESSVNAGPAVYISASGPNPIMVQPFPLQTSSLFGPSTGFSANHAGVATISRNVNIHIHAGGASLTPTVSIAGNRVPNGEGAPGEHGSVAGPSQASSGIASSAAVSSQAPPLSFSGVAPNLTNVQQTPQIEVRNFFPNLQNHLSSEGTTSHGPVGSTGDDVSNAELSSKVDEGSSASKLRITDSGGSSNAPLGLGLGGLQPKRQARKIKSHDKSSDEGSTMHQTQPSTAVGQHVLLSLASQTSGGNPAVPVESPASGIGATVPTASPNPNDQGGIADAMSQVLQSPALDGLLAGVSQQTGFGSPDVFRGILQQFTENPAMRNTMNRIVQQVDNQDLGSMVSGTQGGPGGGFDLSRMMQQMMPIVSQALGGISSGSRGTGTESVLSESRARREIGNQQTVQNRGNQNPSEAIFQSLINRAVNVSNIDISTEVINNLRNNQELFQEFMEMLYHDLSDRLEEERGS